VFYTHLCFLFSVFSYLPQEVIHESDIPAGHHPERTKQFLQVLGPTTHCAFLLDSSVVASVLLEIPNFLHKVQCTRYVWNVWMDFYFT